MSTVLSHPKTKHPSPNAGRATSAPPRPATAGQLMRKEFRVESRPPPPIACFIIMLNPNVQNKFPQVLSNAKSRVRKFWAVAYFRQSVASCLSPFSAFLHRTIPLSVATRALLLEAEPAKSNQPNHATSRSSQRRQRRRAQDFSSECPGEAVKALRSRE